MDILDKAFSPERCAIPLEPNFDEYLSHIVSEQVHRSPDTYVDQRDHWKETRQLFGSDYHKEYFKPVVRRILRDHALPAPDPKRARAKQSRRLP